MPTTSQRHKCALIDAQSRKADSVSTISSIDKSLNSRTSDLSRFGAQTRSPKLYGFYRSLSLAAVHFPAHGKQFGLTFITVPHFLRVFRHHSFPLHLALSPSQSDHSMYGGMSFNSRTIPVSTIYQTYRHITPAGIFLAPKKALHFTILCCSY